MKNIIFIAIFLFVRSETPDVTKLYIAEDLETKTTEIGGLYEIMRFSGKDSVYIQVFGKAPDIDYDFLGDKNLKMIRKEVEERFAKETKDFYQLKGDSIFINRSDEMMTAKSRGTFKNNTITLRSTLYMFNGSTKKTEIIKVKTQVFKPY